MVALSFGAKETRAKEATTQAMITHQARLTTKCPSRWNMLEMPPGHDSPQPGDGDRATALTGGRTPAGPSRSAGKDE
ncbi:hypothetical protein Kpho01_03770 [Kitasatospora phosalacinea]|uniref:Uncharacterized protein n=1 Tax=Kitasatospora phosalacinea TaxID=2065 RepID=A0A9W6PCD5_9ACTN|nr:hypothetical protein Kpho01_03770 [Kitasatospora phosalacinea]